MKFFKNLFKKKEVVVPVVELSPNAIICDNCNKEIKQHEKRVTKNNKKLHIKCWRVLRKKAKQIVINGK